MKDVDETYWEEELHTLNEQNTKKLDVNDFFQFYMVDAWKFELLKRYFWNFLTLVLSVLFAIGSFFSVNVFFLSLFCVVMGGISANVFCITLFSCLKFHVAYDNLKGIFINKRREFLKSSDENIAKKLENYYNNQMKCVFPLKESIYHLLACVYVIIYLVGMILWIFDICYIGEISISKDSLMYYSIIISVIIECLLWWYFYSYKKNEFYE